MGSDDAIARAMPPGLRAALARRALEVQRPIVGGRHGAHRSQRPGVGRDFRDYRAYVPGDDPRRLDWRAAARSQRLVVRQTESERELDLHLLVDASGAMGYGEGALGSKWALASALTMGLTSLATRQGDRVTWVSGRQGEVERGLSRPSARRDRLREVALRCVESEHAPAGDCPWDGMLDTLATVLSPRRPALIVVVSDFLDPKTATEAEPEAGEGESEAAKAPDAALLRSLGVLRAAGHDLLLAQVLHRDELEFPWTRQRVRRFEDLRGRRALVEGPGASLRARYLERLEAHLRWHGGRCDREGLALVRLVAGLGEDPAERERSMVDQIVGVLGRLAGQPFAAAPVGVLAELEAEVER